MEIHYRKALPEEYGRTLKFLQDISPGYGFTEEWFRWKYINNPMGPSHMYFAEDLEKGTLAGVYCIIPWNLAAGNKVIRSVQSVDTMIHPDYRGYGIVKNLSELMFDDLRKIHMDLLFGFPNQDFYKTTLKIGWKNPGFMRTYINILSTKKVLGKSFKFIPKPLSDLFDVLLNTRNIMRKVLYRGFEFKEVDALPESAGEDGSEDQKIQTARSWDYLEWRYKKNPLRKYRFFCLSKNGRVVCCVVANSMGQEMTIVDIIPAGIDNEYILPALVLLSERMRKEGCIALWSSCSGSMSKWLGASGFIYREKGLPIVSYKFSPFLPSSWDVLESWNLMPGDIDAV